jgi:hypothetical protein
MSHTTSIKGIKIVNIDALRLAVSDLAASGKKVELVENATPRAYFDNQEGMGVADYVIKLADAKYDIGLYKQQDGTYEPRTDFWGHSVEGVLGAKATDKQYTEQARLGLLFQAYAVNAAEQQARMEGKMTMRQSDPETGRVTLVVTGY